MTTEILIAGATGTNGREIVRQLRAAAYPVRAMVRNATKAADLASLGVKLVEADFGDPASMERALTGVESAFVATPVHPRHVEWMEAFFNAARHAGTPRVVKLSGMGASEDSPSEIIRMHARSDRLLMESGLPYTILRPNSFHQNMLWSAASIKDQGAFYLPMGEGAQSLIDIRDIARVAIRALTESGHEAKTYPLTGPESLTFHDVAAALTRVLEKPVKYVPVPPEAARAGMIKSGAPKWNADALADLFALFATGKYAAVTDTVLQVTGQAPIPFEEFASEFASAFR